MIKKGAYKNMYISKINIKNFRNFKNQEIEFNDGVNVIIGHNNSGKTNLIKALSLVIDYQGAKRLDVDDFNKTITLEELRKNPPKISIEVTIKQGKSQEPDDLVTVGNWLTKLEEPYEALLTYEFFLPENQKENYLKAINEITEPDRQKAIDKTWKVIKHEFIRLFIYKIWGGNTINQTIADSESLQRFDFQFLDAIRDVERSMLTGRNTLLKEVLDFFMDYDIKSKLDKSKEEKNAEIKQKRQEFSDDADVLLSHLLNRMEKGKEEILSYAEDTGAAFNNANPNFEGSISEVEMFSALKLIV
jgi:putative ATP-dependent endonuclease of OLD family